MKLTFMAEEGEFKCTMENESGALQDVLDEFKQFLLSIGYVFESTATIQIVESGEMVVEREGPTHE
jgi:hypothetical protein